MLKHIKIVSTAWFIALPKLNPYINSLRISEPSHLTLYNQSKIHIPKSPLPPSSLNSAFSASIMPKPLSIVCVLSQIAIPAPTVATSGCDSYRSIERGEVELLNLERATARVRPPGPPPLVGGRTMRLWMRRGKWRGEQNGKTRNLKTRRRTRSQRETWVEKTKWKTRKTSFSISYAAVRQSRPDSKVLCTRELEVRDLDDFETFTREVLYIDTTSRGWPEVEIECR